MNNKDMRDYILANSKSHIRKLKETISMRERPIVTGENVESFIELARKNDEYAEEHKNLYKALKEVELIENGYIPRKTAREFIEEQKNLKK